MTDGITSLFVLGTQFSGSTVIGEDLAAHLSDTEYVGELLNYTGFPELSYPDVPQACYPCTILGQDCPYITPELRSHASHEDILGLHGLMAERFDCRTLIDGSKFVAWLRTALDQARTHGRTPDIRSLITVRNPVAYAISVRHRTGAELWESAATWRDTYVDALRTVNFHAVPSLVVRYEDYFSAIDLRREAISAFLGRPRRAEPKAELHGVGGNPSSFAPRIGAQRIDSYIATLESDQRAYLENFVRDARRYWRAGEIQEDRRWYGSLARHEMNAILSTPGLADIAGLLGYDLAEIVVRATRRAA